MFPYRHFSSLGHIDKIKNLKADKINFYLPLIDKANNNLY